MSCHLDSTELGGCGGNGGSCFSNWSFGNGDNDDEEDPFSGLWVVLLMAALPFAIEGARNILLGGDGTHIVALPPDHGAVKMIDRLSGSMKTDKVHSQTLTESLEITGQLNLTEDRQCSEALPAKQNKFMRLWYISICSSSGCVYRMSWVEISNIFGLKYTVWPHCTETMVSAYLLLTEFCSNILEVF